MTHEQRDVVEPSPQAHHQEVVPLELFFDLVFVFALSQLSHHLREHLSWHGAAETVVMLVAVFAVWLFTSWAATSSGAGRAATRWVVLAVMLLGLFMNASITRAFTSSGWVFVIPFLLSKLVSTLYAYTRAPDALFRNQYFRVLVWLIATAPLWLGGALADPGARLYWWAPAAVIDLAGTMLAHPLPRQSLHSEGVPFEAAHMLERCRLFLIIALGETVLATGLAIVANPMSSMTVVTGSFALAGTVALWSLGFGRAVRVTFRHLEETRNPVRTSLHAANALTAMVAGLIAVAVANESVITHPRGHSSAAIALLMYGGPILFLLAQGWYVWAVPGVSARFHVVGSIALLLGGLATSTAPPLIALVVCGAILSTIAVFGERRS